jgi:tetratricopeptide (TPR) repeat protein
LQSVRSAREEQQALEALHRLDEECVHYQRAVRVVYPRARMLRRVLVSLTPLSTSQNDYLRAFDCMERALVLRRHFFGLESEEVALACRALAEMCNLLAMSFLQQDNFPVAVDLLKKAEVLTAQHGNRFAAEHATTLNNLACYYRRLGKLHAAMTSLRSAVAIERRLGRVGNAADTLLNLCAVLSQLGKHDQALAHAQEALLALQEDVFQPSAGSPSLDRVSVMCIAYHNIGVEQEFLKAYDECVQSYKKVRTRLVDSVIWNGRLTHRL